MESGDLASSDGQQDGILAVSKEQTKLGGSDLLTRISTLPWGVFSPLQANVKEAKWILSECGSCIATYMKVIAEYAVIQAKNPQIRFNMVRLGCTEDFLDKQLHEMTNKLLGRPVEIIRFSAETTLADVMGEAGRTGSVMAAVQRAKCCNPVIVLRNMESVTDHKIAKLIRQLGNHSGVLRCSFVDRSIGVPFDLSRVLFVEECACPEKGKKLYTIETMRMLLLPKILDEHGLLTRKSLFDETLLRVIVNSCGEEENPDFGKCTRILNYTAAYVRNNPEISLSTALINFVKKKQGCEEPNYVDDGLMPYGKSSNMKLPIGCATLLSVIRDSYQGFIQPLQSSFSCKNVILNPTETKKQIVDIVYNYCYSNCIRYGNALDFQKAIKVAYGDGDGPSSGCATLLSLFSLFTKRPVRKDSAVSGEVSLSGRILRIGGVNPKTHAAYRWGVRRMILPSGNKEDVERTVDERLKKEMQFVYVDTIDELLAAMTEEEEVDVFDSGYIASLMKGKARKRGQRRK